MHILNNINSISIFIYMLLYLSGLIKNAEETSSLAQSVEDTDGVFFIPAFSGLGVS